MMKTVFNVSAVQDRDGTVYTSNPVSTMVRKSVMSGIVVVFLQIAAFSEDARAA